MIALNYKQTAIGADVYRYSIVPSISSGNLTVALKNYLGQDPSSQYPVKVQIGDTVRTITSALSFTLNAGSNYFNAGSSELATKEIDYFTYLWVNNLGNMQIGISRIPNGLTYSDFSTTGSNEKFLTDFIGNTTGTNKVTNIGRFSAILSSGTGYTWSTPSAGFQVINYPIFGTKELSFNATVSVDNGQTLSGISNFSTYKIIGNQLLIKYRTNWTSISGTSYNIVTTKPLQDNYGNYTFIGIGDYYSADGHKLTMSYNNDTGKISRGPQAGGALNTGSGNIQENLILTI